MVSVDGAQVGLLDGVEHFGPAAEEIARLQVAGGVQRDGAGAELHAQPLVGRHQLPQRLGAGFGAIDNQFLGFQRPREAAAQPVLQARHLAGQGVVGRDHQLRDDVDERWLAPRAERGGGHGGSWGGWQPLSPERLEVVYR